MAMSVVRQLIENNGVLARAFLGVTLDSKFSAETAHQLACRDASAPTSFASSPGLAAETAKLQVGDVVLRFNGVEIDDDNHL